MRCQSCGADLPEDARFCIECGADVSRQANTGATVVLPRGAEQPQLACNACGAANPSFALFCVRCGHRIGTPATAPPPPPRRDPDLGQPRGMSYSPPPPPPPTARRRDSWAAASGLIFLGGLALLFLFKLSFFPAILFVIGVSAFVGEASRGRIYNGLSSVLWFFGLGILFWGPMTRLFIPGILALVFLSILLGMARKALRIP